MKKKKIVKLRKVRMPSFRPGVAMKSAKDYKRKAKHVKGLSDQ